MKKRRLAISSLMRFLDTLPNEVGDILDAIEAKDNDIGAKKCIPLVLKSLQDLTQDIFDYLPEGERKSILTTCGTWLVVGMLIGAAPHRFRELLLETKAKVTSVDEDET